MKANTFFISLFFFATAAGLQAQTDDCFDRFLREGEKALARREYDRARKQYMAALECDELTPAARAEGNRLLEKAEAKRREELEIQRDNARANADSARQKSRELAELLTQADSLRRSAETSARRSLGNELGYKAIFSLRDGDRTAALRLAEFTHRFADPANSKAIEAMLEAAYFNNNPLNREKLAWRVQTLVEQAVEQPSQLLFSTDGQRFGMISSSNTTTVWELPTGRLLFDLPAVGDQFTGIELSPDLKTCARWDNYGFVEIIDMDTKKTRFTEELQVGGWGIETVSFSENGKQLVVADGERQAIVLDVFSKKTVFTLPADTLRYVLHFTKNFEKIFTATLGKDLTMSDLASGEAKRLNTGGRIVFALTLSPDGRRAVCSTDAKDLLLFDLETGALLARLEGHTAPTEKGRPAKNIQSKMEALASQERFQAAYGLTFSPDGRRLTAFFTDGTVKIFEMNDAGFGPAATVKAESDFFYDIQNAPTGGLVFYNCGDHAELYRAAFSGQPDEELRGRKIIQQRVLNYRQNADIEEVKKDEALAELPLAAGSKAVKLFDFNFDTRYVPPIAFAPQGEVLAYARKNGGVVLRNFQESADRLQTVQIAPPIASEAIALAFSPDAKLIAIGRENGAVEIWDAQGGVMPAVPGLGPGEVAEDVLFAPDRSKMALITRGKRTLKMLDLHTGREIFQLKSIPQEVEFSPDGQKLLLYTPSTEPQIFKPIEIVDANSGRLLVSVQKPGVYHALFDDSGQFVNGYAPQNFQLWDVEKLETPAFLPQKGIKMLIVSDDGRSVVYSDSLGMYVVETASGRTFFKLQTADTQWSSSGADMTAYPFPQRFSPDGKKLIVRTDYNQSAIIELATGQTTGSFYNFGNRTWIDFTPDGSRMFFDNQYSINVLDASTGKVLKQTPSESGTPAMLSPDGKWIATTTGMQTMLHDFEQLELRMTLRGHRGNVVRYAFSPNSQLLATAAEDRTVKCWSTTTGRELFTVVGDTTPIQEVAFSPDNRMLTVWYEDRACTWLIDPDALLRAVNASGSLASLTEEQIYQLNLEQVFNDKNEKAFDRLEPAAQLAFGRYFANQAGVVSEQQRYDAFFKKAESLFQRAVSGLDSPAALDELTKMLLRWSAKLRRDSFFENSHAIGRRAAALLEAVPEKDARKNLEIGYAYALAGQHAAALDFFKKAVREQPLLTNEAEKKIKSLAEKGPDTATWAATELPVYPLPKPSEDMGEGGAFAAGASQLFAMGMYAEAATNGRLEVVASLFILHNNPVPLEANATAQVLGSQTWYQTFVKNGLDEAQKFAEAGLALDSSEHFIDVNLAHVLLLRGNFLQAMEIYNRWKGVWWDSPDSPGYFETVMLQDLEKIAEVGKPLWTKDVVRAAQVIVGEETWDDAARARFTPHTAADDENKKDSDDVPEAAPEGRRRRLRGD